MRDLLSDGCDDCTKVISAGDTLLSHRLCEAGKVSKWVLFLGAGASVAAPTSLPAFPDLAQAVLGSVGWRYRSGVWRKRGFPSFVDPGRSISPEVMFGALQMFDVGFAPMVADVLGSREPNAAHRVAAAVLASGGSVWTTNIDLAVEGACQGRQLSLPARYGRQVGTESKSETEAPNNEMVGRLTLPPMRPLEEATVGSLVKFHGTAERPGSLAFADRDLMTPLPESTVRTLASQLAGATLVLYGYAGADADLADLLELAISTADDVLWFEPSAHSRQDIALFFPAVRDRLLPVFSAEEAGAPFAETLQLTATAFLEAAAQAGYSVMDNDQPTFVSQQERSRVRLLEPLPAPAIASARLVQRFGSSGEEAHALIAALRADFAAGRWHLGRAYGRWLLSRSVYGHRGLAARVIPCLILLGRGLLLPGVRRIGGPIILRQLGLLLVHGRWEEVGKLSTWSLKYRRTSDGNPFPADYYYRSHSERYLMHPGAAAAAADLAVRGLADTRDPERLAGALFESGAAAIYMGDLDTALRRAFELQYRRGRYAIRRWQSWGGWLEALTQCYLGDYEAASEALTRASDRFDDESYAGALADIETAGLLVERVRRALTGTDQAKPPPAVTPIPRSDRQLDDLDLILGDLELGRGSDEGVLEARQHYETVLRRRSCPIAVSFAELGLAEVERRTGDMTKAQLGFEKVARQARGVGAHWLEAQAVLGLHLTDQDAANALQPRLPFPAGTPEELAVGNPRVLWTLTI